MDQMTTPSVEDALRAEILRLTSELRSLRDEVAGSIDLIGSALLEEAENRGWCSEYDDFVDGLNDRLGSRFQLPVRRMDRTITLTYSVTIEIEVENVPVDEDESETIDRARSIAERGSWDGFSHAHGDVTDVTYEDGTFSG